MSKVNITNENLLGFTPQAVSSPKTQECSVFNDCDDKDIKATLDSNGSIIIGTMQDELELEIAKDCDKNKNGTLELQEINAFLKMIKADRRFKKYTTYKEERDHNGNLSELALITREGTQALFSNYNNGSPQNVTVVYSNGTKYIINLTSGEAKGFRNYNDKDSCVTMQLSKKDIKGFKTLGSNFENTMDEILYRISNFDFTNISFSNLFK